MTTATNSNKYQPRAVVAYKQWPETRTLSTESHSQASEQVSSPMHWIRSQSPVCSFVRCCCCFWCCCFFWIRNSFVAASSHLVVAKTLSDSNVFRRWSLLDSKITPNRFPWLTKCALASILPPIVNKLTIKCLLIENYFEGNSFRKAKQIQIKMAKSGFLLVAAVFVLAVTFQQGELKIFFGNNFRKKQHIYDCECEAKRESASVFAPKSDARISVSYFPVTIAKQRSATNNHRQIDQHSLQTTRSFDKTVAMSQRANSQPSVSI